MIIGAHSIIYSKNPDADRAVLRDVFKLPFVDVGDGWLIFGLPPAEVAVHPSPENDIHEFYLMCENVETFVSELRKLNVECGPISDQGWGLLTQVRLPGGGILGVYQARHARPGSLRSASANRPAGKTASKRKETPKKTRRGKTAPKKTAQKKTGRRRRK